MTQEFEKEWDENGDEKYWVDWQGGCDVDDESDSNLGDVDDAKKNDDVEKLKVSEYEIFVVELESSDRFDTKDVILAGVVSEGEGKGD